jgi:hypothetical protein
VKGSDASTAWERLEGSSENGWEERRRIASVIVGWKRPPWEEYALRCVGRTWP